MICDGNRIYVDEEEIKKEIDVVFGGLCAQDISADYQAGGDQREIGHLGSCFGIPQ